MACPRVCPAYARFPRWSRDKRTLRTVGDWPAPMWRRRQRWTARCKNALQLLNELKPGLEYRVVSQSGPCHQPVFTVHVHLSGQTFEGVGTTKQKAKTAAAERALRRGFVQFRDVEPVVRILQSRDRRDVTDPSDNVIDFTADEWPTSQRASVETIFADFARSSVAASVSSSPPASAAGGENDVGGQTVTTSSG